MALRSQLVPSESQLPLSFDGAVILSVDQVWGSANADLLRVLTENRRVERKPVGIHAPDLAEYFSMWANTAAEGGLVAVGVSDDGQFTGCLNIETAHINRLEKEAHDMCPDAHVECRHIDVQRDKDGADDFVLLFRVHYNEHRVVHTVRNRAYIRRGESKHRLTPDEVGDLRNDKREVSIEQQLYPQYIFPDHFDAELVSEFVKGVRASVDDPVSLGVTPEELFQIRRLGKFKDDVFVPKVPPVFLDTD